jgi:hypothetical protein
LIQRSRSSWAVRLFAAAGTAFLGFIVFLGLSGGGLSYGSLPEPINSVAVVFTWISMGAAVVLFPLAVLASVLAVVGSWVAPSNALPDVGEPQVGLPVGTPPITAAPVTAAAERRRQTRASLALVAMTVAAAYLWSETTANRSLEVMPIALIVLGASIVLAWVIIRTK